MMQTHELAQKVKQIKALVQEAMRRCQVHENDLLIPVKIVVDPICPCGTQKNQSELTVDSYMRCRHCDKVYHVDCFNKHRVEVGELAQEQPFNHREKQFMTKYIFRYFKFINEKDEDAGSKERRDRVPIDQQAVKKNIQTQIKTNLQVPPSENVAKRGPPRQHIIFEHSKEMCQKCDQQKCICIFLLEKSRKRIKLQESSREPDQMVPQADRSRLLEKGRIDSLNKPPNMKTLGKEDPGGQPHPAES